MLIHLLPILLLFLVRLEIALPILFLFGAGYSVWLGYVVYDLRARRKQFRFEFFYFGVMSAIAVVVLAMGFSLPYVDHVLLLLLRARGLSPEDSHVLSGRSLV